jgi:hypothetical protein
MVKCCYTECPNEATHIAPQIADARKPHELVWRPICGADVDAWWEGSDFPGGEGAPAQIRPVADSMELRLCHTVGGKLFVGLRDEPRHQNIDDYSECIRTAYGSLNGVTISTVERAA